MSVLDGAKRDGIEYSHNSGGEMIDTVKMRAAVQDGNHHNIWLNGSTHYEGCEYTHYPCAVLKLCDEVDALRAELASANAEIARLNIKKLYAPCPTCEVVTEQSLVALVWHCGKCNKDHVFVTPKGGAA